MEENFELIDTVLFENENQENEADFNCRYDTTDEQIRLAVVKVLGESNF